MANQPSSPCRSTRIQAAALTLAGIGVAVLSPNVHAGFSAQGSVQGITLTALDPNGQPVDARAFSLNGTGAYFARLNGATTTSRADPWSDLRTANATWIGTGTRLPPSGLSAHLARADTGFGYQSDVDSSGLSVQASARGSTRDVAASSDLGSQHYGENLVNLAPHTTLEIDATVTYALQQDGMCIGNLCDAAFLQAGVLVYDSNGSARGNSVFKAIAPVTIASTAYGSFLARQLGQLSGTEHLLGWIVNDTDGWANYDFYIAL